MHYTVSKKPAEYLVLFQIKTPQSHRVLYFSSSTDFLCLFTKRKWKQRAALKPEGTLKWFVSMLSQSIHAMYWQLWVHLCNTYLKINFKALFPFLHPPYWFPMTFSLAHRVFGLGWRWLTNQSSWPNNLVTGHSKSVAKQKLSPDMISVVMNVDLSC